MAVLTTEAPSEMEGMRRATGPTPEIPSNPSCTFQPVVGNSTLAAHGSLGESCGGTVLWFTRGILEEGIDTDSVTPGKKLLEQPQCPLSVWSPVRVDDSSPLGQGLQILLSSAAFTAEGIR